jgi:ricin-type beta-trefoil lectin protein
VPPGRRSPVSVTLRLPGISIGVNDVGALFKRGKDAGLFLLVSRACGLALDTAHARQNWDKPILWPPHALRHQLWYLRPSGHSGEALVISADNGLALDATRDTHDGRQTLLWEPHAQPQQRWGLEQSPDGVGYLLACAVNGHALTAAENAEPRWVPWLTDRDGSCRSNGSSSCRTAT